MTVIRLSVLLFREGDSWTAQGLDYDITAQGKTLQAAANGFAQVLCHQALLDIHHGLRPLQYFKPAPAEYFQKFVSQGLPVERTIPDFKNDCLPAYMINAIETRLIETPAS